MKPIRFVLPLILIVYALLYMATKYPVKCDEACQRYYGVDTMLRKDRPYVLGSYHYQDSIYLIQVVDSVPRNWHGLADTACTYMQAVSLPDIWILISNGRRDTLAWQRCP